MWFWFHQAEIDVFFLQKKKGFTKKVQIITKYLHHIYIYINPIYFPFFSRARLKNVDRSSATYHSVTVDDFTVVITEFKPKVKKEKKVSNSSVKKNDKNDKNGHDGHDKNGDDNR